jgi:hypothetical protein
MRQLENGRFAGVAGDGVVAALHAQDCGRCDVAHGTSFTVAAGVIWVSAEAMSPAVVPV